MSTIQAPENVEPNSLDWILAYDDVTGFYKLAAFMEALNDRLRAAHAAGGQVIVCKIALNRLREITDLIGDGAMETFLVTMAANWRSFEYDGWLIGREAQDRFLMASSVFPQGAEVNSFAERVFDACQKTLQIQGMDITPDVALGVSVYPVHADNPSCLSEFARVAMIHALDDFTGSMKLYDPEMSVLANQDKQLIRELPNALRQRELTLMYTPVVDLRSGATSGFSSRLYWNHSEFGELSEQRLTSLIQQSGLSIVVGEYLLELAVEVIQHVQLDPSVAMRITVPMFAHQLRQSDGLERLRALKGMGSRLELLVPESVLSQSDDRLIQRLNAIKSLDIGLSVDGIGAGVTNFTRHKRFPLDRIWLDEKYIRNFTSRATDNALVKGIISLLHSLGYEVVAQGVGTQAQQAMLTSFGCDFANGLMFGQTIGQTQMIECARDVQQIIHNRPENITVEKTVLLLDDEPNVLNALKRLLRKDEYQIFSTTSPQEAFDILAQQRIDVIVSDQRMPELSGTEFLSQVKELYPDTVRLVLSGYTELQSVTDAINRGAIYKFLTKPWDDEQLRANIREAFLRLEVQRENSQLHREVEMVNTELVRLNHILEQRVMEKNERIVRDNAHLQVMQEVLDNVTVCVIGVDTSGDIVMSNKAANHFFCQLPNHTLIGLGSEVLPKTLHDFINQLLMQFDLEPTSETISIDETCFKVDAVPMGQRSQSQGILLTLWKLT